MKSYILSLAVLFSTILSAQNQKSQGYQLTFNIDNVEDSVVYLAYFYGKGQFYRDTTTVEPKGKIVFEGKDTLEHGMYSLITSDTKLFDFMVDNQKFSASSDMKNIVQNMEFEGSPENKIFYDYLKFLNQKQQEAKDLRSALEKAEDPATKKKYEKKLAEIDRKVKVYLELFHQKHEGTLSSNFILSLKYPEVPEPPKDLAIPDSTFALYYFKNHYFDNFDFSDGRLVRTPSFHDKIVYYLDNLTYQNVDSIIASVDVILQNAKQSKPLFKYALSYLTSRYERSEKMGMDAVFVHLVLNYFAKGMADDWYKEKDLKKLVDKAKRTEPLLIGKKAPNLLLKDTSQTEIIQLYNVDAKYTILYIWSPTCGHCKVATPKLLKVYHKYKDQGVKVYAVNEKYENEEWLNFINEYELDFINVGDGGDFVSNFRDLYDVFSTPQTYLLDKDKKIIAKKISIESLDDMLDYYLNEKDKKSEK